MKKRILTLSLTLVVLFSLIPAMTANAETNESEPNETWQTATPVDVNTAIVGGISSRDDVDFYTVTLDQPGTLQLQYTTSEGGSIYIKFYEIIGDTAKEIYNANSRQFRVPAGTYCVSFSMSAVLKYPVNYILNILHTPEPGAEFEKEWNDTWETANALKVNTDITGNLKGPGDNDWYKITLDDAYTVQVHIATTESLDVNLYEVTDGKATRIQFNNLLQSSITPPMNLQAGIYYVLINDGTHFPDYIFSVETTPLLEHTIHAAAWPESGGTVIGGGKFLANDPVALTTAPNIGWTFIGWYEGFTKLSGSSTYKFNATASRTIEARFTQNGKVTITATASPADVGSASGSGTYDANTSVTLRARANSGWMFEGWYSGGMKVSSEAFWSITASIDMTVEARFVRQQESVPNSHSTWASPELARAATMELIPQSLLDPEIDYTKPITRAEFAGVAVRAYEILANTTALPEINNPFTDTKDADILKAYRAGIMVGVSATAFEPDTLLNREQCATALTRVFKRATISGWSFATDANHPLSFTRPASFADDTAISAWAAESVYFMAANGIIQGVGGNMFAPRAVTNEQQAQGYAQATREQALIIALRMVENLG